LDSKRHANLKTAFKQGLLPPGYWGCVRISEGQCIGIRNSERSGDSEASEDCARHIIDYHRAIGLI
jgi:hypothetical protein